MHANYPHLFQPFQVKGITFRNRIFSAPNQMCNFDANGLPTGTDYSAEALAEAALSDKKRAGGDITLVVPRAPTSMASGTRPPSGGCSTTRCTQG